MKKYLIYFILAFLSLIPILNVNAETSATNQDVFMDYNINQVMEWIYNSNSTEYLLNLVSDYDYKLIDVYSSGFVETRGYYYHILVFGSNTQEKLWNRWRQGYVSGFMFNQPIEKEYEIIIYTPDYINYYDIDHHIISNISNYTTYYINQTSSVDLTEGGGGVSFSYQNISYTVYYNTFKLKTATGTNRPYTLYDLNSNLIGSYTIDDIIPGYIELFHGMPNYLNGYKTLEVTPENVNTMLSGVSSGSIFIPYDAYLQQHGTLGYFDVDVKYQPYTSIIEDVYLMPDGLYYRQDFDLSTHSESEFMTFYKYLYLEGEDNYSYNIYIPNDMYSSTIEGVLDSSNGKYDYSYEYKDENGDIQEGSWTGQESEFLKGSPLLGDMFKSFSSNTFGLTSIITAPLVLITQITGGTCQGLTLPIPYTNTNMVLPCMYDIYEDTLGSFFDIYQMITFGIVAYWVIIKFFNLVKDFKNPDHDEIEVMDL